MPDTAQPSAATGRTAERAFGLFLLLIAANAVAGGVYGMAGATDVPREWLRGSPFSTYLVPSLILLIVVGGTHALAGVAMLRGVGRSRALALAAGTVLLGWIGVQVAIIGYVSWLQPAMCVAALVTIVLATRLRTRPR